MNIGVLSDTHLVRVTDDFRRTVETVFRHVDMIIHAGDMTGMAVYDYLSNWQIVAVRGNMDDHDLRVALPEKRVEDVAGKRIGIVHGRGTPYGIEHLVYGEFDDVDVIIYGHSHIPQHTRIGKTVLFNPGTFRGYHMRTGTAGIMEIGTDISFHHIDLG
jgi:putative phosphoesterase